MVAFGVTSCVRPRAAGASMSAPGTRFATALAVVFASVAAPDRLLPRLGLQQCEPGVAIAAPLLAGKKPSPVAKEQARSEVPGSASAQKRCRSALLSKLSKVPVFIATNDQASPFLSQRPGGDQSALMFLYPAEAQTMLKGILRAPNGASSGARLTVVTLERAYTLALKPPVKSGMRDPVNNRELYMLWQLSPGAAEVRSAQALLVKSMKAPVVPKLPAYMVPGLEYVKQVRLLA